MSRHPPPTTIALAPLRLLVIEDNEDDIELMRLALHDFDASIEWLTAQDEAEVGAALARSPELILCDFDLPALSPMHVLKMLAGLSLETPLIVVTRAIGEDAVVELLRHGARDYVAKDKLAILPQVIDRLRRQEAAKRRERRMHAELEQAHAHLRALSQRAARVQELERVRLARSLHDGLGQSLSGIHLLLEAADGEIDPGRAAGHRAEAHQQLQEAIAAVKDLSFELRSPQLDVLGLPAAVRAAAARALAPTALDFRLQVVGDERSVPEAKAAVALALVREALTNTIRHARARQVTVRLRIQEAGRLAVLYADDGAGFDRDAMLRADDLRGRLGLTGMAERCELAGGRLWLKSRPGAGTVLRARL